MAIRRMQRPPHQIALTTKAQALYEVALSAVPSPPWRAAFLRPPTKADERQYGRARSVGLSRATMHVRTAPPRARFWLRRIDRWIAYANSVVVEWRSDGRNATVGTGRDRFGAA